jgi:small subunit ribosomal protein S1
MVTKRRMLEESVAPPPQMDESWWESVLAEDEAKSVARSAKNSRYPSSPDHLETDHEDLSDLIMLDWKKATDLYDQDQVVELIVSGCNRGGLLVHGDGLQGFVPVSHLVETPCSDADLEKWLLRYIDQSLALKVIECDQERGRVVFSERAAQSQPGSRKRLLKNLQPGHCVVGTVTNVTDFGVFVDLGGVEGLIHVSEISWGRVHHPNDVLQLGQQVDVYVIHVDQDRARVALSLKRMHPNPWETAEERYVPGMITEATVTSIVNFGAFARLEEGLDGLIHVSEFSAAGGPVDMNSLLHEGQRVEVRILHVDASRQRLGLSLKLTGDL